MNIKTDQGIVSQQPRPVHLPTDTSLVQQQVDRALLHPRGVPLCYFKPIMVMMIPHPLSAIGLGMVWDTILANEM